MSIHDGHRQRMRNRFLKSGLANMETHEVLELLLYHCIPRSDTNALAHRLIKRYKTLRGVLQAPVAELMAIEGVGEGTATFLSLLNETVRYVNVEKAADIKIIESVEHCVEYVCPLFDGVCNEQVYMVCLDAKLGVLGHHLLCEGAVTSVTLSPRSVLEIAMKTNAASVVLVHNHPGGLVLPSAEDIDTTRHLAMILNNVNIPLIDHIIVSDRDFLSMARTGNLRNEAYLTGYMR